jgi:mRNA interferase MazF
LNGTRNPRAGEIWDVSFSPQIGHEQGGIRPALVVSVDGFNDIPHSFRIVAPITGTDRGLPNHLRIAPPEGGLTKPSVIMCEQVKSQSVLRFRRKRGDASLETVEQAQRLIGIFLNVRAVAD